MPVTVEIAPTADCLAMAGSSDVYSTYSLSGNVVLRYQKARSLPLFQCYQPLYYTLISVELILEGHHDAIDPKGGFASLRICRIAKQLVAPSRIPLTLSPDSHRHALPFDLAVPAWIPPSWLGTDGSTSYALFANAKVVPHYAADPAATLRVSTTDLGNIYPLSSPAPRTLAQKMSMLCIRSTGGGSASKPKPKLITAEPVGIAVGRFRSPDEDDGALEDCLSLFPIHFFSLSPKLSLTPQELNDDLQIKLFQSLHITVGLPAFVGVQEMDVPVCVAVESTLPPDVLARRDLVVSAVSFEVEQVEAYRTIPTAAYLASHPIPPPHEQPPHLPLLTESTLANLSAAGLLPFSVPASWRQAKRVDPPLGAHPIDFPLHTGTFKANLRVPLVSAPSTSTSTSTTRTKQLKSSPAQPTIWPDMDSPFCTLHHELAVAVRCTYLDDANLPQTETLRGRLPLRFTAVSSSNAPVSPAFKLPNEFKSKSKAQPSPMGPVPAYAQLYDEHGQVRCSSPLPLYSPKRELEKAPAGRSSQDFPPPEAYSQPLQAIAL